MIFDIVDIVSERPVFAQLKLWLWESHLVRSGVLREICSAINISNINIFGMC